MKANELRIGNKVLMAFENVIETVNARMIGYINKANENGQTHPFEPIPLTPEILEKCGFENRGIKQTNEFTKETLFVLYNIIDGTSSFVAAHIEDSYGGEMFTEWQARIDHDCIYTKELEYLHQLQNLYFALTGQELAIKDLAQ